MVHRRQTRGLGWQEPAGYELGRLIGEALGAGIAEGLEASFGRLQFDLKETAKALAGQLRERAQAEEKEFNEQQEALRQAVAARRVSCSEDGCEDRAVARGLCRKHYSSRLYYERKERRAAAEGTSTEPRRRGRRRSMGAEGSSLAPVVPVAPIVRRKSRGVPDPVEVAPVVRPTNEVSVEQVARFLHGDK
jgi:hypothetical protein